MDVSGGGEDCVFEPVGLLDGFTLGVGSPLALDAFASFGSFVAQQGFAGPVGYPHDKPRDVPEFVADVGFPVKQRKRGGELFSGQEGVPVKFGYVAAQRVESYSPDKIAHAIGETYFGLVYRRAPERKEVDLGAWKVNVGRVFVGRG